MDIQVEKLKLIKWLAGLNDLTLIHQLVALKQANETDWWNEMDEKEKAEIELGLKQADQGEVVSHEDVMRQYGKWL
jgi:predicted transcriptional regulator